MGLLSFFLHSTYKAREGEQNLAQVSSLDLPMMNLSPRTVVNLASMQSNLVKINRFIMILDLRVY